MQDGRRAAGRDRPRRSARSPTSSPRAGSRRWAAARRSRSARSSTGSPSRWCSASGWPAAQTVSVGLLAAIFVSNLPEAIGGATDMRPPTMHTRRQVMLNWLWIAVFCALATSSGYAGRGHRLGRAPGRHQRLRGRRADRDAGRLDDPRGDRAGRQDDRPRDDARVRGGGGAVARRLAARRRVARKPRPGADHHGERDHDDQRRLPGAEDPVDLDLALALGSALGRRPRRTAGHALRGDGRKRRGHNIGDSARRGHKRLNTLVKHTRTLPKRLVKRRHKVALCGCEGGKRSARRNPAGR